jgi:hypothetical protein
VADELAPASHFLIEAKVYSKHRNQIRGHAAGPYYSIRSKIVFDLALNFYINIQIDSNKYRYIYKTYASKGVLFLGLIFNPFILFYFSF